MTERGDLLEDCKPECKVGTIKRYLRLKVHRPCGRKNPLERLTAH